MSRRLSPRIAAVAVLLAAWALPTSTAEAAGGGSGFGHRVKAALAQLDLSATQKQQIKAIVADPKTDRGAAPAGAAAAKGHGAGKATMEKVMAVLTQPQKAKFKQLMHGSRPAKA